MYMASCFSLTDASGLYNKDTPTTLSFCSGADLGEDDETFHVQCKLPLRIISQGRQHIVFMQYASKKRRNYHSSISF